MVVVFDTNVYRSLVRGRTPEDALAEISNIKDLQRKKGIHANMSCTVAEELLSHLYDGGIFKPNGHYTTAIRIMYAHCTEEGFNGIIPLPVVQIAQDLFGQEDKKSIEIQNLIVDICGVLYTHPTRSNVDKHKEKLMLIKKHNFETESVEADFLRRLGPVWRKENRTEEEKSQIVKEMTALSFVAMTAKQLGLNIIDSLSAIELIILFRDKISEYMNLYPATFKMREISSKKLSNPKYIPDKKERVNQVWDEQILHVVSLSYNKQPILLVTDDKGMKKAAIESASIKNTPFEGNVATLDEYIAFLNQE